jgi:2'-5' RNA ligase
MQRIFIAINLPGEIKDNLESYKLKFAELPCRWVKKENFHITLSFLGNLSNEEVLEVIDTTKKIAEKNQPFSVKLNHVGLGPTIKNPRFLWVTGEKSPELYKIQKELNASLFGLSSYLDKERDREYIPHITLGRIRQFEFRRLNPEDLPVLEEDISLIFKVSSIDVMSSVLKKGGSEYSILESCRLGY